MSEQTKSVSTLTRVLLVAGLVGTSGWGAVLASQGAWHGWLMFGGSLLIISSGTAIPPQMLWVKGYKVEWLMRLAGALMLGGSLASIAGISG